MDKKPKKHRFLKKEIVKRQPFFQPALKSAKRPKLNFDELDPLDDEQKTSPSKYEVPYLKQEGKSGDPLDLNIPQEEVTNDWSQQTPPLGDYKPSLQPNRTFRKSEYINPMGPINDSQLTKDEELRKEKDEPTIVSLKSHSVTNRQIRTIIKRLQKAPDDFLLF